jgi:hypothetical protein
MCEFKDSIDNIVLLSIIILIFCKHIGGYKKTIYSNSEFMEKKKKKTSKKNY